MAKKVRSKEKLPWELTEEILSRVPPTSLVRFRAVSKQWNALFNDKKFINNHKATFRFILTTNSKIYSVSINPKIEVRELVLDLDIPVLESRMPKYLIDRNHEFVLCCMKKGAAIWNPWLKQTRWIEDDVNQGSFEFEGMGYKETSYVVLGGCHRKEAPTRTLWRVYDFASNAWKDHDPGSGYSEARRVRTIFNGSVSLNGYLYWVTAFDKTFEGLCIMQFECSTDSFSVFCDLPCVTDPTRDASVLAVFKEDRFSYLKQCHVSKKIEVWVTKNKINGSSGKNVEWLKFMEMEVSCPNLPDLVQPGSRSQPSYFIEDKTLVVCFCHSGGAWIYVMEENKLIRKIQIDVVDGPWVSQYIHTPSLVQVPSVQRQETELQAIGLAVEES